MHNAFPVVHIGLPKTGSTTLQKLIWPQIPNFRHEVVYNPSHLADALPFLRDLDASPREERQFRDRFRLARHLISNESLAGWNPRTWERRADKNLRMFGRKTTILLTARKTEPWLRSVYQQAVLTGHVVRPESFFLARSEYENMQGFIAPNLLTHFDVDSFDLEFLVKLYSDRFESVHVVPFEKIWTLDFLKTLYNFSEEELEPLRTILASKKVYNRAYSSTAMTATFFREWMLEKIFELNSHRPTHPLNALALRQNEEAGSLVPTPLQSEINRNVMLATILQVARRVRRRASWAYLMQEVLDRIWPYTPYQLPSSVYRNQALQEGNDSFLEMVQEDPKSALE